MGPVQQDGSDTATAAAWGSWAGEHGAPRAPTAAEAAAAPAQRKTFADIAKVARAWAVASKAAKAWEAAVSHPHDFRVAHRGKRPSDGRFFSDHGFEGSQRRRHERIVRAVEEQRVAAVLEERREKEEAKLLEVKRLRDKFRKQCAENAKRRAASPQPPRSSSTNRFWTTVGMTEYEKENELPVVTPARTASAMAFTSATNAGGLPDLASRGKGQQQTARRPPRVFEPRGTKPRPVYRYHHRAELAELDEFEERLELFHTRSREELLVLRLQAVAQAEQKRPASVPNPQRAFTPLDRRRAQTPGAR